MPKTSLDHPWQVVLFNDEVHSFEEVIHQVQKAIGCPLERAVAELLLLDDAVATDKPSGALTVAPLPANAWQSHPAQSAALYRLLASAHYRTSPLDLRRMMLLCDLLKSKTWQTMNLKAFIIAFFLKEPPPNVL